MSCGTVLFILCSNIGTSYFVVVIRNVLHTSHKLWRQNGRKKKVHNRFIMAFNLNGRIP